MSLFSDIANALGHTVDSLAQEVGEAAGTLENLVSEFESNGIDVLTAASKLHLPVASFLRSILDIMGGDPHQRLLQHIVGPVQPTSEPIKGLSSQWMQMGQLHQHTAQQIDKHMNDLFLGSATDTYKSPAADALLSTHRDYQNHFTLLVDHAQTQQWRHATLGSHVDDYLSQAPGKVYSLSAPMAALGVLSLDTATVVEPPPSWINPNFIQGTEESAQNLQGDADSTLPGLENPWWDVLEFLVLILYLFVAICLLINWIQSVIQFFQGQQKSTPPPKKSLKPGQPGQGPQNSLSPAQEGLAKRLHNDYSHLGLSLDDIKKIIEDNPNLTEGQLRQLLAQYANVIKANPNLVSKYGALEVFMTFVSLSAYDPAHGGNYAIKKPSVERDLYKGVDEAMVELGAMEMGLVDGPLTPSTSTDYEATDSHGQNWDVKSPRSTNPAGKPIFDAAKEAGKMQKDFDNNEKIIIDDTNITPAQRKELYKQLKANGNDGKVIWWPFAP